ncbi:MAG: S8 family serine peptidase, partial [Gemmatimonadales bacterium]
QGSYRTPRSGTFRFGRLDEQRFTGNGLDLNRDGNPAGASRVFGVLWDPASGEVWVDTDQDLDFNDEPPLHDFAIDGELGRFGRDNPSTPVRESVAFGVQIEAERGYVVINPGIYGHGTMVHGAVAANRSDGGRVDGVAPEARLAAIKYSHRTYGLIEGLIHAYRDPDIDLVILQQNVVIAIPYLLQDGRFTASVIADRLVAKYGKPLFVPASNVPGLNTTSEHGVSEGVISVGAYQSAENYLINSGVVTAARDNLHSVGSYGPGGNGGMQPDLLAPAAVPTVNPGIEAPPQRLGLYALAPGYALCAGTSCATPVAAGAAALLISAAKQTGLEFTADQLREALYATTRTLPGIPSYQQGRGLIQVGAAWEMLQQLAKGAVTPMVTSTGPVRTRLSSWLQTPGVGAGIYEREGWRAGQREERRVALTRTTGPKTPVSYEVAWTGDNNTFTSPPQIILSLGRPVTLPVTIAPERPGAHSATLSLRSAAYPGLRQQTMAVVIAAHQLDSSNGYTAMETLGIPRPGRGSIFIDVPEGTRALRVGLDATGIVQLGLRRPDGRQELPSEPKTAGAQARVVADPMPGVWEAIVTAVHEVGTYAPDYPKPLTPISATLRATAYRVEVTAAALRLEAADTGTARGAATISNHGAAFTGAAGSTALGTARQLERDIGAREQHRYEIEVPSGSTELLIEAKGADGDDLDLYLFDCTRPAPAQCIPAGAATNPDAGDRLSYRMPAAGRWVVIIDAARLTGAQGRYRYLDVVVNPALGALSVADADTSRGARASWRVPVSAWLAATPTGGRTPVALLQVAGDSALTHHQRTTSLELIGPKVKAVLGRTIVDLRRGTQLSP